MTGALLAAVVVAADTEVVVHATKEVAESSASVTVIPVDENLPASSDVASAVAGAPGTSVRRLGGLGDLASVSIRGSSSRQVEIFLDGVPLNPEGASSVNLAELPLRAFERIEVYRGNAPPELGGSPIGGVIHLVTGDPSGAEVRVGGGSWGTWTGHASAATGGERGDTLLAVEGLRTNGRFPYLDDRGTAGLQTDDRTRLRQNNDRQQAALHLRGRRGPWTVLSTGLVRETGVPGFTWLPVSEARFRTVRELLVLGWQGSSRSVSGGVSTWGLLRDEVLDDPAGELSALPGAAAVLTAGGGARGHFRWTPGSTSTLVGALEVRETGVRSGSDWVAGRLATEGTLAGVIHPSDRIAVSPVVQLTGLRDSASGETEWVGFVAPRSGLVLRLGEHIAITANAGLYLRPPDLQERFGNQGALVGNVDLRAERGGQVDLGLRAERGEVRGEAVAFAGRALDRIGWLQNSQGRARPENLDRVDTVGAELASAGTAGWVDWTASLTWTRARQVSEIPAYDGQAVTGVPEWEWHHRVGAGTDRAGLGVSLDASTGTPLDQAGFFVTAPRWITGLDARVGWRGVSLGLDVLNVLNRTTEQTPRDPLVDDGATAPRAVTDFFGYPLPGRTVLVSLGVSR